MNDDVNEFDPDTQSPSEYNPYDNKDDFAAEILGDDSSSSGDAAIDGVKKNHPEDGLDSNSDDQIDLPDFMQDSASMSDFKDNLSKNSPQNNSASGGVEFTNQQVQDAINSLNDAEMKKSSQNQQASGNDEVYDSTGKESVDAKENASGGNTDDKPEEIRFKPKQSADDADKRTASRPKVLKKKFILSGLIVIFGCAILFTFLMPTGKKQKDKNGKQKAEIHHSTDYESMAKRRPSEPEPEHYKVVEAVKEEEDIPPVIVKEEKLSYQPQNISHSTGKGNGSRSSVDIPDTRNDRLQGKSISGIKGLTSSQQKYSTDYQETVEKNSRSSSTTAGYSMPSKEEYMNNVLGAYSQAYGNATSQNNSYAVQNDQHGKNSFYNNGRNSPNVGQGNWLDLNTLWQGTIFEATLTSELNTDLPGEITARIAKNIYSSQDGRFLLIPQNSIVYGTYNSSISYSQNRVQVGWHTLIRPDGYQIQLGNMNGTDAKGASGLKGKVNDHPMAYLKAIGLMSVFSIVNTEFSKSIGETNNEYTKDVMANSQKVTMELGEKLIDRAMNVQPTIVIKAGTKINIVVNHNLSLPPCEAIPVTQQYHKQY